MTDIVPGQSTLGYGDFIVYPVRVHRQPLPPDISVVEVDSIPVSPTNWIRAFASPNAGFYATSGFGQLPYAVRREPMETFHVLRVEKAANR
jgi:hypothetical protein